MKVQNVMLSMSLLRLKDDSDVIVIALSSDKNFRAYTKEMTQCFYISIVLSHSSGINKIIQFQGCLDVSSTLHFLHLHLVTPYLSGGLRALSRSSYRPSFPHFYSQCYFVFSAIIGERCMKSEPKRINPIRTGGGCGSRFFCQ